MGVDGIQQVEEALRESERKFRDIAKNIPGMVYQLRVRSDGSSYFSYASPKAGELFGLPDDLESEEWELGLHVHPQDREQFLASISQAIESFTDWNYTGRMLLPDGSVKWFQGISSPTRVGDEIVFDGILLDVTERKHAEEALREAHQLLETILDHTHMMVAYLDPQFNFLRVNLAYAQADEREPSFFPGKNYFDLYPNETNEAIFRRVVETGGPHFEFAKSFEYVERPEREVSHWDWSLVPIKDSEGTVLGLVLTLLNVTERVQAEVALRESEERLQSLIENMPIVCFIYDQQGHILSWNRAAEQVYGYTKEEAVGANAYDLIVTAETKEVTDQVIQQVFAGKTVKGVEWQDRDKEGRIGWRMGNTFPLLNADGSVNCGVNLNVDVTERKQADKILREKDYIIESASSIIATTDLEGNMTYANPAFLSAWGFDDAKEFLGKPFPEFWMVEDRLDGIVSALWEEGEWSGEIQARRKDGTLFDVQVSAAMVLDRENNPIGLMSSSVDITERKQAEKALRDSEERYRTIFEGVQDAIFVESVSGEILAVNSRACEMFGYPREVLLTKTVADLVPPGQPAITLDDSLEQGVVSRPSERVNIRASGERFPVEITAQQQSIGDDTVWLVVVRDITKRKQAEEELSKYRDHLEELVDVRTAELEEEISERKQMAEKLQESEEKYRLLVESTLDWVWAIDISGVHTFSNEAVRHCLGYEVNEVVGTFAFPLMHSQDQKPIQEMVRQAIEQEQGWRGVPIRWLHKDGSVRYFESSAQPTLDTEGHIVGFSGIDRDITERRQAEEELRKAKEAADEARIVAEAANRAKSIFLANMSHELRTPLNAILGFTQLMRRDPAFPPAQHEKLRTIQQSGEHLLELINDVLEMSKIEAGHATFTETDFDLYQLLDTLETMFDIRARNKGLRLYFERAPNVSQYIRTDERKLHQVLINLLSNAVKFTEAGHVTLQVSESASQRHTDLPWPQIGTCRLLFEVQDTGIGIAPEETDRLFEAFTQTASGQEALEGTGLGLALSQRFAQLMGGGITVESQVGQGSVFRLDIQVIVVEAGAVQARQPERRVVGLAPGQRPTVGGVTDGRPCRILVVEDQEASRKLLVELLQEVGFDARAAANGREAIAVWEAWDPHLIWMDMRMPVMDGYEATGYIKSRGGAQAPIIIALTASAFEEDRAAVLAAGCDDFVRKPFQVAEIFDKMAQHLGVRYVYKDLAITKPDGDIQADLTPDDLSALPAEWIAALRDAAIRGKSKRVLELVDRIQPDYAPLAKALVALVHEFRFDKIVALTRQPEEENKTSSSPC